MPDREEGEGVKRAAGSEGKFVKKAASEAKGWAMGYSMQTRFRRIPDANLHGDTVAGIRDMKTRNGATTIRFDTGLSSGTRPNMNIDPFGSGYSQGNPHVNLSEGTVNAVAILNRTLKYAGVTLTLAAVAIDSWRLYSAVQHDKYIEENREEIIEELKDAIGKLEKQLFDESNEDRQRDLRSAIKHLKKVKKDVKRSKKLPVKSTKTASSVVGGWSGGALGGAGGAWAGAKVGAAIGSLGLGPAGAAFGAPLGAVLGAIGCGIAGGTVGSKAGEAVADKAMETFIDHYN